MRRPAKFEFRDTFADFLPANGVPRAGANYLVWMNRAATRLGRSIGPSDLSCEADVQRLLAEIHDVDHHTQGQRLLKNALDVNNQQSTFRKYAQMVQSNFRGLFTMIPVAPAPIANDVPDGLPDRIKRMVHRFVRDTKTCREIKRLYEFRCQICGVRLEIEPSVFYAEAHHIQPLGGEHKGPDVRENILCLCPNHHALFDYFATTLDPAKLRWNKHALGQSFVHYHNSHAAKRGISTSNPV
jgi:hypothetical protein